MSGWGFLRDRYETFMKTLDESLHQKNAFCSQLEKIEEKTKIPRLRLVQALLLVLFIIIIFTLGSELISNCVGFLYPAYASIKAIESLNKDDDTRWLTYWVVYGFFIFVESISDCFLSWFPFYWVSKCIFLVWCMLPSPANGSDFIYNFIIRPFFLKHQKNIDNAIDQASSSARGYLTNMSSAMQNNLLNSRQIQNVYNDDFPNQYDDRDGFDNFSDRMGELRQKYADQRVSPERSLEMSRARLFNNSMKSRSRSPERISRERKYSNDQDDYQKKSRNYPESYNGNALRGRRGDDEYSSNRGENYRKN